MTSRSHSLTYYYPSQLRTPCHMFPKAGHSPQFSCRPSRFELFFFEFNIAYQLSTRGRLDCTDFFCFVLRSVGLTCTVWLCSEGVHRDMFLAMGLIGSKSMCLLPAVECYAAGCCIVWVVFQGLAKGKPFFLFTSQSSWLIGRCDGNRASVHNWERAHSHKI